jgi:hypothetical protein
MKTPDLRWDHTDFADQDEQDSAWELLVNDLTEFMNKADLNGSLHCEVKNFGWRHLNGYKDFNAHTGQELLRQILPHTDCTFDIWLDEAAREIRINNAHHDAPTGGELYSVTIKMEE